MPGKSSRARRVEAVRRAKADVYRNRGGPMTSNPFTDGRQARIYTKYYNDWVIRYARLDALVEEMREVYGG